MKKICINTGLVSLFLSGCVNIDNPLNNDLDKDGVSAFDGDCDDGDIGLLAQSEDMDCDGVLTVDDCDDGDIGLLAQSEDMDCDGVLTVDDCDDGDVVKPNEDSDCDGVLTVDDCDDGDANTVNDSDCDGVLTVDDCDDGDANTVNDMDCDGVLTVDDCDDGDANTVNDMDCDGVLTVDDCDDGDANTVNDMDCDGVLTVDDCDDGDANTVNDMDCDGVLTVDDCDDGDANTVNDMDCDGVFTVDDCDDNNANSSIVSEDSDCNGVPDGCSLTNCDISVDMGNGFGADFVLIEGSDLIDPSNRYTLENAFYMMTTEVTQGMFQEVMGYDSRDGESTSYGDGDNYPAYYANWHMSAHFANTLSIAQGEQECYSCSGSGTSVTCSETMDPYLCTGYSLPTEHEWEIAARSGTTSEYWTGEGSSLGGTYSVQACNTSVTIQDGVSNPPLSDYAWFCGNSNSSSQEVGTKLPNGFGLYDMHGNLREWTSDWYGCTYPNGGTWCNSGSARVFRGGSWTTTRTSSGRRAGTTTPRRAGTATAVFDFARSSIPRL